MSIRVLHLSTDSRIAGAERLLIACAKYHDRQRFDVQFCTLADEGPFGAQIIARGGAITSLNCHTLADVPRAIWRLRRLLQQEHIDILHSHLFHASVIGSLASQGLAQPVPVLTRHYSDLMYLFGSPFRRVMDRWIARRQRRIIAISQAVQSTLVERERVSAQAVSVIHNGIDLEELAVPAPEEVARFRAHWGLEGRLVIGTIASLHPRKGHRYLLEAVALLQAQYPMLAVILVGDGALRPVLEQQARRLGLQTCVRFLGQQSDIRPALAAMDVVVQPSVEEGFGISILEAMAFGKPVVGTRVGGMPEIIDEGVTGRMVPARDPSALAEAIHQLLADPARRAQWGAAGRARVAEHFRVQTMVMRYEACYAQLLNGRGH